MPEKVMPGPVSGANGIREAVCVHTKKIIDSCKDKDCLEDLRVYLGGASQEVIERASCVKNAKAELLYVSTDVEPVGFNRGFYTVDARYYYLVTAEAYVGAVRPIEITGLAVFDKRVILYGGEGGAKTFSSKVVFDSPDAPVLPRVDQPTVVVEAVDPLVLGVKLVDPCDSHCCGCNCNCNCNNHCGCGCNDCGDCGGVGGCYNECPLFDVPNCIASCLDSEICFRDDTKRLYICLGQFSIIRMERDTQLLIPAYDYCVPCKDCPGEQDGDCGCVQNPCQLFKQVRFPMEEFFPIPKVAPPYDNGGCGCGCCDCCDCCDCCNCDGNHDSCIMPREDSGCSDGCGNSSGGGCSGNNGGRNGGYGRH